MNTDSKNYYKWPCGCETDGTELWICGVEHSNILSHELNKDNWPDEDVY